MKRFNIASLLDRVILAVAPRRGLDRIEARTRAGIVMNFDAASNGRRVKGWKAPATDADAASLAGRATLRQRARDMIRNAPFARRAQAVVTNNIVGSGIAPSLTGGRARQREAAAKVILPFLNSVALDAHRRLNLRAMQTVVANAVFESGEVLVLRRTLRPADVARDRLPLAVELLEIDHLCPTVFSRGKNEVRDGIEYDAQGVAVAYHLYETHPGAATRRVDLRVRRVPASDILHIRRVDRPGQGRGVPWLAPVMIPLGEMRDYQEAQILKQKISALLAGVVEAGDGGVPEGQSGLEALAPGAFVYTEQGEKVIFTDPPAVNDYDAVMRLGLSAVAMGIGITYESLSGDLGRVNYSSMRAGRLEMDANIQTWQEQILIGQFCEGVGRWALDAYRLTKGDTLRPMAFAWTAQRRPLIDPVKEIPSILKKVKGGLSSLSREQRAMGLDPDEIARERAEDQERLAPFEATVPATEEETE